MPPTALEIYSPIFFGAFISAVLYGITLMQMFLYYQLSKRDPLWMKLLILYLFFAESAITVVVIGLLYEPLVMRFGQTYPLATSPLLLRADAIVTAAISTPVQIFMAWRIWILTGSPWSSLVISALALVSFSGGIWTTVSVSKEPQFADFHNFTAAPTTWLVASAVSDVLITVCLVFTLSRKKTGFSAMDDHLSRIIRLAVQTGALTAIAALADAIVFIALPGTTIFFAWDLFLSKLYAITVLSSLNARKVWNSTSRQFQEPNALFDSSELPSVGRVGPRNRFSTPGIRAGDALELNTRVTPVQINVHHSAKVDYDREQSHTSAVKFLSDSDDNHGPTIPPRSALGGGSLYPMSQV